MIRFRLGTCALALLSLVGCASPATGPGSTAAVKGSGKAAPLRINQEIQTAEMAARHGDKKAYAKLRKIAQQHPGTESSDEAEYAIGDLFYNQGKYEDALTHYQTILHAGSQGPVEVATCLRASQCLVKLGRLNEVESLLDRAEKHALTADQALDLTQIRVQVLLAQKKGLDALHALNALAAKQDGESKNKTLTEAQDLIDSRLSEDELKSASGDSSLATLQNAARYRYALILTDQKQYGRARDYFSYIVESAPGTDMAERAGRFIQQIDSRNRVDSKTVGVILPLSGKQASIGLKALHGIELGLGVFGSNPSGIRLAVIDSDGNPDAARRGVERLVQEDNVIAIVGGLLSKTATAEASKAQEFGVPIMMLSQKSGLTEAGESVFRNALTGQMQIHRLVEMAMDRLDCHKFAILFPNDAYGTEYANFFWDEVRSRGGEVVGAQPYDPKETDFHSTVQRLVGTYYFDDRTEEYKTQVKAWEDKNPHLSTRHAAPALEDILPPAVDFDAIFLPDDVRAVGQIAPMLAYSNVTKVRLLGTNLWNSAGLVTRGQKFVEGSVFVDSLGVNDPNFKNSPFFTNFKALYGEDPGAVETQSYDSGLILRKILTDGESTRIGLAQKLAGLQNFSGAMGALSINSNREIVRPLAVLTVKNGQIQPLEDNPR